jgi:predicted nucleic acid-binding protein
MVIVDTGFWLALADRQDTYHKSAKRTLQQVDEQLITTWCVVTETCYMLLKRKGVPAQVGQPHTFLNKKKRYILTSTKVGGNNRRIEDI